MAQPSSNRRASNQTPSRVKSSSRPPAPGQRHAPGTTRGGPAPKTGSDPGFHRSRNNVGQHSQHSRSISQSRHPSHATSNQYSNNVHIRLTNHSGDARNVNSSSNSRLVSSLETSSDVGSETSSGHYRRAPSEMFHESKLGVARKAGPLRQQYSGEDSPVFKKSSIHSDISQNSKSARKVIEELNKASGSERRIAAITNACAEFDHMDEPKHNAELHYGAPSILSKILSMTDDDDEIRMICAAIEMVFRGSTKYVHVAFDKVGPTMIPLLLRLLDRCESGNMKHADVSILNITKTLLYLSRIVELRVCLARQQGMLDAMRRVATSILNPDCRIARIRIVANLANCEENKVLMLEHEGLLDSILRIGHLDLSETAREYASTALMDLASAPANQVSMAKNEKLLGTLVKMVLVEKIATTRESAITALQNLAFTKDNRKILVNFKDGIVLEALKKALNSDKNDKARRRAAGALTNLACEETAEKMGSHKGLLDSMAIVSTKDENEDVQMRASLALTKIASNVTNKMDCYEALLDALVVASLSSASNSVSAVIRVKARDPENRESMARHPGILDTLADICISPGANLKDKDNAMRAIMHLTNENSNRKHMCNKTVLEALVKGAAAEGKDMEDIRDSAIRAIERLATEISNRPYMARHEGLLVAIAKATEREAKIEETGTKIEHALLAKPLLMSLLVAM